MTDGLPAYDRYSIIALAIITVGKVAIELIRAYRDHRRRKRAETERHHGSEPTGDDGSGSVQQTNTGSNRKLPPER